MGSKLTILSFVTLLVLIVARADASYALRAAPHDQPFVVLKISDLRSACLQRAGVVRYDESNRSPDGLRQQLQRHFDVVLSLLDLCTQKSIDIAVARLQARDDHAWSAEEQIAWRQKLQAARAVQLQRLAAYRDRGIFPLNEGQSAHPVPIFVDRHDTACAVGHLMRCSGWSDAVVSIQQSNNLIYVPDAANSALAEWVLTSGLTLEEAALIQPGYYWPAGQFDAANYEPGEAVLQKDGLNFSNFQLQAQNFPTDTGAKPALAGLGLSAGKGTYNSPGSPPFPQHIPNGTNWIAIGGTSALSQSPLHSLAASAATGGVNRQMVVISFDVKPTDSGQQINGISESSYSYWQGFQNVTKDGLPPAGSTYYADTFASDGATNLAEIKIDQTTQGSYFSRNAATQSFAPTQQIHVETTLWLQNGVTLDTYLVDFNVVPEPTSPGLAAMLMVTFGVTRTKLHRR